MKVIGFIREQRQQFQQRNNEFKAKLEPKFKNISDLLSDRLTKSLTNTLNNPWLSKFSINDNEEVGIVKPTAYDEVVVVAAAEGGNGKVVAENKQGCKNKKRVKKKMTNPNSLMPSFEDILKCDSIDELL